MSYYEALGLTKEPFSTSPDPEFFYHSQSHETVLKRLEIAIRLKRGLSVVFGDVGAGKTTLSRRLFQSFKGEDDFIFHMILDPSGKSEFQFLSTLVNIFGITTPFKSTMDFKEAIEKYLFQKAVEEGKTLVLLIDEGQKISLENLELLRMLLNYETNDYKLLQLVLLAQMELLPRIQRVHNLMDRVAFKYTINPFDETETREMIDFRLKQAGYENTTPLFAEEAVRLIYLDTQGYPRKITMLCHEALESLIMRDLSRVSEALVQDIISQRMAVA